MKFEDAKAENLEMSQIIESNESELSTLTVGGFSIPVDSKSNFVIETRNGGKQYFAATYSKIILYTFI